MCYNRIKSIDPLSFVVLYLSLVGQILQNFIYNRFSAITEVLFIWLVQLVQSFQTSVDLEFQSDLVQ